jgi:hypothetical protein
VHGPFSLTSSLNGVKVCNPNYHPINIVSKDDQACTSVRWLLGPLWAVHFIPRQLCLVLFMFMLKKYRIFQCNNRRHLFLPRISFAVDSPHRDTLTRLTSLHSWTTWNSNEIFTAVVTTADYSLGRRCTVISQISKTETEMCEEIRLSRLCAAHNNRKCSQPSATTGLKQQL